MYKNGGVCSSSKLVKGIHMKNGNQQITKTPITMPRVSVALCGKKTKFELYVHYTIFWTVESTFISEEYMCLSSASYIPWFFSLTLIFLPLFWMKATTNWSQLISLIWILVFGKSAGLLINLDVNICHHRTWKLALISEMKKKRHVMIF